MVFNKGKRNHLRSKDLPHCIRYEVLLLDSLPLFWAKSFSDSMAGESNLCSIGEETVELGVGLHWQFEISLYFDEELQQVSLPLPEQMLEVTTFAKAGRLDMPLALLRETHSCVKTTCSYIWMHVYQCLSTMNSRVKLQCVPRPQTSVFRIWPQVWKRNRTDFWIGDSHPRIHCQVCCRGYANACSFFVALSMLGQLLDLGEGRVTQQTLPVREANLKMRRKSENMCISKSLCECKCSISIHKYTKITKI